MLRLFSTFTSMKVMPLLFLFALSYTSAQDSIRFKRIVRSNASSITSIWSFHQDVEGYIWMGAPASDLIRFDGTNFRQYSYKDFQNPQFQSSYVALVFEDAKHQVWAGTDAGGLYKYNRNNDTFTLANDSVRSPKARISCFTQGPDESFWLGSLGGGLIMFQPETNTFKHFKAEKGNTATLPDNYITALAYDADGLLWVSTTGGLCSYDASTDRFQTYTLNNANPDDTYRYRVIRTMHLSRDKIYLGTYGGLQVFDRISKTSEHLIHRPNVKNSLSHNSIFRIVADEDGKFWIATFGGGLNCFDPSTQEFTNWKSDPFNTESLPSNNLFSLYLDRSNLIWVGAADNTVAVLDRHSKRFHRLKNRMNDPNGISSGWIRTMVQENDSIFYFGFNGQGLNRLNLKTGLAEKFVHLPESPNSIGHNSIVGLASDAAHKIWIALEGGGLNKFDPVTKKFTRYVAGKNSINNNALSALLVDSDNLIWTTAYRDGLNIYDINQNKFTRINNDSLQRATGISLAFVESIFEVNGNIWFNAQNQVVLYDKARNQFVKIAQNERAVPVNKSFFLEIKPYSNTEVLLATQDEARIVRYFNPDSIVSLSIFKAKEAERLKSFVVHRDEIWYTANNQLVRWNPAKNETHAYTQADGLVASDLNKLYIDKQGRIFVTSIDGLTWFYPDEIRDDTLARKIVFTDFKLFNNSASQKPDSIYHFSIAMQPSQLKSVQLNHTHSFFSISYTALEFMAPEKIQYAYRLTGFDKDWVYVGNRTFASYTNLDPGTYLFEVKSTNPDGYWGNEFAALTLIIQPPFWRTGWFMLLVLLATGTLLYMIHRYRLAQSLKLERLRTKIASDLHDEVGSSLTKISIYSELVQNGLGEKEKANYLQSIGSLSREVVSTMSDIVWSINNNNDTLSELTNRMKDFATEVLEAKGIDFEFVLDKVEKDKSLEPIVRQNIYLIFKEAINNVVKHAKASHVKVYITSQPQFELHIIDNGIGLPAQETYSGNGLRNMRRRAQSIGGSLSISPTAGTTIKLAVP